MNWFQIIIALLIGFFIGKYYKVLFKLRDEIKKENGNTNTNIRETAW